MIVGVTLTKVIITDNSFVPQDPPKSNNTHDKNLSDLQVEKEEKLRQTSALTVSINNF